MTTQTFTTESARIGALKGAMLKHAIPKEVLGITGEQHEMKKNMSDTVIFRRWLPFGGATTNSTTLNQWVVDANAHLTVEGVTPDADTIAPQDISVVLQQYSCLYMYTDKLADLYEDDVPAGMLKQAGQRMGLVREMIRYGALKGCTNKFYAGGGSSRTSVNNVISLALLRAVSRSINGNHGSKLTEILSASPNYATSAIEAAYLVFCHTDCENDIREIPGFVDVARYGTRKPVHECELGSVDSFRFIISPELDSIADSGATVAATGLLSTTGTDIDVYPFIMVGEDAWGDVALRGLDSFSPTHQPHTAKDKSDPLGQRGYIGGKFWSASFVQNDGWMAVVETGVTDL